MLDIFKLDAFPLISSFRGVLRILEYKRRSTIFIPGKCLLNKNPTGSFKVYIYLYKLKHIIVLYTLYLNVYFQELYECKHVTTNFADGLLSTEPSFAGNSWLPLADLKPSCNNSDNNLIMTSARLEKNGTDIRYNSSCCRFKIPLCHRIEKSTQWKDLGREYLFITTLHVVDCGDFAFISAFQLENNSTNIRYSYTCCQVFDQKWKDLMQCNTNAAKHAVKTGSNRTLELAELPVSCNAGFGLSRLKIHIFQSSSEWGFEFRCCKVTF